MPLDFVPVISQTKSLVQFISGDSVGARETQENFSRQCPVVSQARSGVEYFVLKDKKAAAQTHKECVRTTKAVVNGTVDSIPLIGHCKGAIHYCMGDKKKAKNSLKASTRTTVGIGGAVSGFLAAGPAGAYGGYFGGILVVDAATNGGHVRELKEIVIKDGKKKAGKVFDLVTGVALEAVAVGGTVDLINSICTDGGVSSGATANNVVDSKDMSNINVDGVNVAQPADAAKNAISATDVVKGDSAVQNLNAGTTVNVGGGVDIRLNDVSSNIQHFEQNLENFAHQATQSNKLNDVFKVDTKDLIQSIDKKLPAPPITEGAVREINEQAKS